MRLICTLKDQNKAYTLSSYLTLKGIENQMDITTNTDWGSPDYGLVNCTIWSIDEEDLDEALEITKDFLQNSDDPKYSEDAKPSHAKIDIANIASTTSETVKAPQETFGIVTLYLLILCSLLLFTSTVTAPTYKSVPKGIPYPPVYLAPINKTLMYDYPKAYEIIDQIIKDYSLPALQDLDTLPQRGKDLLVEFAQTPYWQGIYDKVVAHIKDPNTAWNFNAPLFEKERQGEVWRLFTPSLLHSDIFHLLFNMIWLVVLGRQMEQRMSKMRYIIFIMLAAFFTSTAQYLMSGSNFLGFSGVLCAMLTFIWFRQKNAAWEGYILERGTMGFITFFILFMFAIQTFAFFLDAYTNHAMPFGIANTAHIVGAVVGYVFSKMHFFAWRT